MWYVLPGFPVNPLSKVRHYNTLSKPINKPKIVLDAEEGFKDLFCRSNTYRTAHSYMNRTQNLEFPMPNWPDILYKSTTYSPQAHRKCNVCDISLPWKMLLASYKHEVVGFGQI
jgi:hypothetical protein